MAGNDRLRTFGTLGTRRGETGYRSIVLSCNLARISRNDGANFVTKAALFVIASVTLSAAASASAQASVDDAPLAHTPDDSSEAAKIATATATAIDADYRRVAECGIAKNRVAVKAWVDDWHNVGSGDAEKFLKATGSTASLKAALAGCVEQGLRFLPYDPDRLASDWGTMLGWTVPAPDPTTTDRVLGVQRVGSFSELVSCIRAKNSASDIQAFIAAPSIDVKVQRYSTLSDKCLPRDGVNLDFNFGALERALVE